MPAVFGMPLAIGLDDNIFDTFWRRLQDLIEKVSVFRKVTNFRDSQMQDAESWKLAPLYNLYLEYANILAAHGQLFTLIHGLYDHD